MPSVPLPSLRSDQVSPFAPLVPRCAGVSDTCSGCGQSVNSLAVFNCWPDGASSSIGEGRAFTLVPAPFLPEVPAAFCGATAAMRRTLVRSSRRERRSPLVYLRCQPDSCRWFWAACCGRTALVTYRDCWLTFLVMRALDGWNVGCFVEVGVAERQRFAAALRLGPCFPAPSFARSPLPASLVPRCAVATALYKAEFGHPALICF